MQDGPLCLPGPFGQQQHPDLRGVDGRRQLQVPKVRRRGHSCRVGTAPEAGAAPDPNRFSDDLLRLSIKEGTAALVPVVGSLRPGPRCFQAMEKIGPFVVLTGGKLSDSQGRVAAAVGDDFVCLLDPLTRRWFRPKVARGSAPQVKRSR